MSSTSGNNKLDSASFSTGTSRGVIIVVMVGVTDLIYLAPGTVANLQLAGHNATGCIGKRQDNAGQCTC